MIVQRGDDPGPFSQHREYVGYLRKVFSRHCAYCLTPDDRLGGEEGMKVDHFTPESRHRELRLAWVNLYYCCDVCNNRKSNFPTDSEIASGKRFVDPCAEDPDNHFCLAKDESDFCKVVSLSIAAEYEVKRLQFNRRPFLRDFWRELSAMERNWQLNKKRVLELSFNLNHNENVTWLLDECDRQLSAIRERWPFPRSESGLNNMLASARRTE